MHPTFIEFLARDRIADLHREAAQPHVPERGPDGRRRAMARARVAAAITAIGRRVRRPTTSPVC